MEPEYLLRIGEVSHQVYGVPPKPATNKQMVFSNLSRVRNCQNCNKVKDLNYLTWVSMLREASSPSYKTTHPRQRREVGALFT
jgi:hypothetical protein